jgi:hypothetical protein
MVSALVTFRKVTVTVKGNRLNPFKIKDLVEVLPLLPLFLVPFQKMIILYKKLSENSAGGMYVKKALERYKGNRGQLND